MNGLKRHLQTMGPRLSLVPAQPQWTCASQSHVRISDIPELLGSLKLGNVRVFVQLIFGPCWPMNQINKNPNIA